jgi:NAD(P)-dependent dehydrogenase (short-subunit alcohol dehydrogenase family)
VAVASLGGWTQSAPITSVAFETWERIVRDNLTTHFLAMKTFVPLLAARSGAYVHINGFSAEQPYPGAAPVAAMAAAQKALALTLAEETRPVGLRVHELILGPVMTRARLRHGQTPSEWLSSEDVGDYIAHMLERQDDNVLHRPNSQTRSSISTDHRRG